jgi:16S rRNA (uracil1498-N3)-methyltransferase
MARLFVPPEQLTGEHAIVDGEAHRHLTKSLRLRAGDAVTVFDGCGVEIEAVLVAVGAREAQLALGTRRSQPPPPVAITLLQSVPKGERLELVIQKTTELGVAHIVPVITGRGVMRPGSDRRQRWETIAREAARQCGRADVPTVDAAVPLAEALGAVTASVRLVLWEQQERRPLMGALMGKEKNVAVLVGPEGGFSEEEIAAARAAGFVAVGVGPRILRSETAGIVAVTLVQAICGGLA